MGIYRNRPGGKHEWIRQPDGQLLRRLLGPRFLVQEGFAGRVAKRLQLKRCIELGEIGSVDLKEADWPAFVAELKTLSRNLDAHGDGTVDVDYCIAIALEFMAEADKYRGQGECVVSIAFESGSDNG